MSDCDCKQSARVIAFMRDWQKNRSEAEALKRRLETILAEAERAVNGTRYNPTSEDWSEEDERLYREAVGRRLAQ